MQKIWSCLLVPIPPRVVDYCSNSVCNKMNYCADHKSALPFYLFMYCYLFICLFDCLFILLESWSVGSAVQGEDPNPNLWASKNVRKYKYVHSNSPITWHYFSCIAPNSQCFEVPLCLSRLYVSLQALFIVVLFSEFCKTSWPVEWTILPVEAAIRRRRGHPCWTALCHSWPAPGITMVTSEFRFTQYNTTSKSKSSVGCIIIILSWVTIFLNSPTV